MTNNFSQNHSQLYQSIFDLYHLPENQSKLLFHGWHHIKFVYDKTIEFATELKADIEISASAALLHDLNYIYSDKLEPEAAAAQIKKFLMDSGYSDQIADSIVAIIEDSHLGYRKDRNLSEESKALADADTLFKALPTTPILFASKFITQNKYDIEKLANKVVGEQKPLMEQNTYFYTKLANDRYLNWAKINLELWSNVLEALQDPSIKEMLTIAGSLGVI